jgi:hypothetical protein
MGLTHPCRRADLSDYLGYYAADLAQGAINEKAKKSPRRASVFKILAGLGALIFLEALKGSINQELCEPLKPLPSSKMASDKHPPQDAKLVT